MEEEECDTGSRYGKERGERERAGLRRRVEAREKRRRRLGASWNATQLAASPVVFGPSRGRRQAIHAPLSPSFSYHWVFRHEWKNVVGKFENDSVS